MCLSNWFVSIVSDALASPLLALLEDHNESVLEDTCKI